MTNQATITAASARRCEITIRRPNGIVETIVHPTIAALNDTLYAKMRMANRTAGRGECLAYRNIDETPAANVVITCDRCGAVIANGEGHEQVVTWSNGAKVINTYCDKCHTIHTIMRG